ncbi:hypothetical protein L1987_05335 [Smallanthus sonchifolius]|uniref:Uncharacterized protein n=1 Tax=Smallanthus sonchifolius TaxID=185202 RepID=A0ACB9JV25_9ASTR|nr:hypothetical protein L1987_05335 [Smallanthus sonchifolius]
MSFIVSEPEDIPNPNNPEQSSSPSSPSSSINLTPPSSSTATHPQNRSPITYSRRKKTMADSSSDSNATVDKSLALHPVPTRLEHHHWVLLPRTNSNTRVPQPTHLAHSIIILNAKTIVVGAGVAILFKAAVRLLKSQLTQGQDWKAPFPPQ